MYRPKSESRGRYSRFGEPNMSMMGMQQDWIWHQFNFRFNLSQNLVRISVGRVLNNTLMGSDHFPIICKLGVEVDLAIREIIPRWKFKTADILKETI